MNLIGGEKLAFVFELFAELLLQPVIEGYAFLMMRFANKNKKINMSKVRAFVVFECIVLFVLFVVGGVMLLETTRESLLGKILLVSSVGISFLQIIIGCVLRIINKEK